LPIAAIRGEGTSEYYFPKELPALANFAMQKVVSDELESINCPYHTGICFTSNLRFWEFNPEFIERLKSTRAQAIEMECATLFIVSYKRRVPLGALLLVSDLPLNRSGIKSKESADHVFSEFMNDHLEKAIAIIKRAQKKA
jgi:AMP nucleosidase